ncbi:MAG: hypothetical protein ACREJ4_07200 [Candidatus Methylomirabilaceae bacterium]
MKVTTRLKDGGPAGAAAFVELWGTELPSAARSTSIAPVPSGGVAVSYDRAVDRG